MPMLSAIGTMFAETGKVIFEAWIELLGFLFVIFGKLLHFGIWAIAGALILPCVFVAGTLYPKWEKWGDNF